MTRYLGCGKLVSGLRGGDVSLYTLGNTSKARKPKLYVVQKQKAPGGAPFVLGACYIWHMKDLSQVTLIGIDCVNLPRLKRAFDISGLGIKFKAEKMLTSLPGDDERIVNVPAVNSVDAYSQFCIEEMVDYVDTSHALIIQYDGFVLNPEAWSDEYLEYDYIGAPVRLSRWANERNPMTDYDPEQEVVGNGGFCLRSRRLLALTAELLKSGEIELGGEDDWVLSYKYRDLLESHGMRFAPLEVARRFAFEGQSRENYHWTNQFGFHHFWRTEIASFVSGLKQYQGETFSTVDLEKLPPH